MKRIASALFLILIVAASLSSSTWEGSAMMGSYGEFPSTGLFAACNSFDRNTAVEVRNLENDRIITVIVTQGLSSTGIFMVLSPEAAGALDIVPGAVARVQVSSPRSVSELGSPASRGDTADPDFNPSVLAKRAAAEAAARGAASAGPAASSVVSTPVAPTPVTPEPTKPPVVAKTPVVAAPPARESPPELVSADPVPEAIASKPAGAPLPSPVPAPAKPAVSPAQAVVPATESPRPPAVFVAPRIPSVSESLLASSLVEPLAPPEVPSVFAGVPWPGMAATSLPFALHADPEPPLPAAVPELVPEDRAFLLALERARKEGVEVSAELMDARFQITPEELALVMALERPGLESFVASASLYDPPYDLSPGELAFAHEMLRAGREEGPAAVFLHDPDAPGIERALAYGIEEPEPVSPELAAFLAEPGLAPGEIPGVHDLVAAPALAMEIPELALDEGVIRIEEGEFAGLHVFDAPPPEDGWLGDFALHDPDVAGKETPLMASGRVLHPFPSIAEPGLSEPVLAAPVYSDRVPAPAGELASAELADPALLAAAPVASPVAVAPVTPSGAPESVPAAIAPPAPAGPVVVSVEPTSPRPPSAVSSVPPSLPSASKAYGTSDVTGSVLVVAGLEKGSFYIQLGAYADLGALETAAARVSDLGSLLAETTPGKDGRTTWRLVLGPLGRDESGVALLRAKSLGFRDAFLKKGS
ncbi:MAG: SPOR domain-containing protein [Spirochaetales bacterium]|nr:SPOR domain-containing protein [Spirochaetales bacterium]